MCFLSEEAAPEFRPIPRIAWAVPVDIVTLGASLVAFEKQLPLTTAFRLCNRFSAPPMPTLPQEILELILGELHSLERADVLEEWRLNLDCFQGRCSAAQHIAAVPVTEELWAGHVLMDEEAAEQIAQDAHSNGQEAWLERTCMCRTRNGDGNFTELNEVRHPSQTTLFSN